MTVSSENSEVLALNAATWLVGNEALCQVFLGATGANETDLTRQRVASTFRDKVASERSIT